MPGDVNCDGSLDPADVAPFSLALIDPVAYTASHPGCDINRADTNGDQLINGRDIESFAGFLINGPPPVPTPLLYQVQVRELSADVFATDGGAISSSDSDFKSAPDFEPYLATIDLVVDTPTSQATALVFHSSELCDDRIVGSAEIAVSATVALSGSASSLADNVLDVQFQLAGPETIRLDGSILALGPGSLTNVELTGPTGVLFSRSAAGMQEPILFQSALPAGAYRLRARAECDVVSGFGTVGGSARFDLTLAPI